MNPKNYPKVAVIEQGCCRYHYALYDPDIRAGDTVAVTGKASNMLQTVAKVIDASKYSGKTITAEVIAKVDVTEYNKRVDMRNKEAELKKKLGIAIKNFDTMSKYELYAEKSPEIAELLQQHKSCSI